MFDEIPFSQNNSENNLENRALVSCSSRARLSSGTIGNLLALELTEKFGARPHLTTNLIDLSIYLLFIAGIFTVEYLASITSSVKISARLQEKEVEKRSKQENSILTCGLVDL